LLVCWFVVSGEISQETKNQTSKQTGRQTDTPFTQEKEKDNFELSHKNFSTKNKSKGKATQIRSDHRISRDKTEQEEGQGQGQGQGHTVAQVLSFFCF